MVANLGKQLAELREMPPRELRKQYERVFGEPTRVGNRDWLFKRIAWRIQALSEGDLSERARRRAEELARDADLRTTAPEPAVTSPAGVGAGETDPTAAPSGRDVRVPPRDSVLTRVYRGQAHHVVVRDDGFEYDGRIYRSLSAIAKVVTGTHWNGLLFFNLAQANTQRTAGAVTRAAAAKRSRRRETADA